MLKTAKAAGIYQSKFYRGESFDKIQIVTIREILEEQKRLDIRLGFEVLKSARAHNWAAFNIASVEMGR